MLFFRLGLFFIGVAAHAGAGLEELLDTIFCECDLFPLSAVLEAVYAVLLYRFPYFALGFALRLHKLFLGQKEIARLITWPQLLKQLICVQHTACK